MTYPPNKQMLEYGFLWERQEHRNGIDWNRYSEVLELQGMMYRYYRNTNDWYFHPDSKMEPIKVSCPNIEKLYQAQNPSIKREFPLERSPFKS